MTSSLRSLSNVQHRHRPSSGDTQANGNADSKAYLIRQVLHDWPDKECQTILKHIAEAMRPGYSKVLVNEFIVPEVGASDFITACDLVMMGLSGGMERTEGQWTRLLASAGLRIEKVWTLNEQTESVIEAVLV